MAARLTESALRALQAESDNTPGDPEECQISLQDDLVSDDGGQDYDLSDIIAGNFGTRRRVNPPEDEGHESEASDISQPDSEDDEDLIPTTDGYVIRYIITRKEWEDFKHLPRTGIRRTKDANYRKDATMTFKIAAAKVYAKALTESQLLYPDWTAQFRSEMIVKAVKIWQSQLKAVHQRSYVIHHAVQLKKWFDMAKSKSFCGDRMRAKADKNTGYKQLDEKLHQLLFAQRLENKRITFEALHHEANGFAKAMGITDFVSQGYVRKMMKRGHWKIKHVKRQSTLSPTEVATKAQSFHSHVYRCLPFVDAVVQFDEIPDSISGSMGVVRTIAHQSDDIVKANFFAAETKRCASVIPITGAKKVGDEWVAFHITTVLLFIGENKSARIMAETYDDRVTVAWTKCGVMTAATMNTVILPKIRAACNREGVGRCLCILDSARSHTAQSVKDAFHANNIIVSFIPGGMTSNIQWVDVSFAAAYKATHRRLYIPYEVVPKSAQTKRLLLSYLVGESVEKSLGSVVDAFTKLGYLDPLKTEMRTLPGYKFAPPPPEVEQEDKVKIDQLVQAAIERHQQPQLPDRRRGFKAPRTVVGPMDSFLSVKPKK